MSLPCGPPGSPGRLMTLLHASPGRAGVGIHLNGVIQHERRVWRSILSSQLTVTTSSDEIRERLLAWGGLGTIHPSFHGIEVVTLCGGPSTCGILSLEEPYTGLLITSTGDLLRLRTSVTFALMTSGPRFGDVNSSQWVCAFWRGFFGIWIRASS